MKKIILSLALITASQSLRAQQTNVVFKPNSATPGVGNIIMGRINNTTTKGENNVIMGYGAGQNNTMGSSNVFIGNTAGAYNTTGWSNVAIGTGAGQKNTTGQYNVFLGITSGHSMTLGDGNTFVGPAAGYYLEKGTDNIFIGSNSGKDVTKSTNNTLIGPKTSLGQSGGYIGTVNATAIGYNARVEVPNGVVLGSTEALVGIGTSAPTVRLHVKSSQANKSGVRLENLTSNSPATRLNQSKFLTVDEQGNVVMGTTRSSARVGAEEVAELWKPVGDHLQSTHKGGLIIGDGISQTPAGYRLYVSDGILTEKVKVAIKTTNDWSDRVFEKDYKLRSLEEVEQHIQQHGYLPGVPSAREVVEKGVDIGRMDAKLLEKVEELTLYLLQQKKQIEQQREQFEQQIAQLKRQLSNVEAGKR
ncbi:bZIP transcription factor [Larkinella insperata]|uniref:BZIP transcription factor n=1 Tax=Larkinella insperata TaxID=332158 RepID=A0ABW3QKU9_9BACT